MDHLDRRTIEHVMTRAAGRIPPKPMSYLQVCLVMETAGKQRRQRYYTWEHYRALLHSQKLNDDRFDYLNDDHRDEFVEIKREHFYTTEQELVSHEKAVSDGKKPSLQGDSTMKKKQPGKNPIINGLPKRGRPRKEYLPGEEPKGRKKKPKVIEGGNSGKEKPKKARKRKADEMEEDADDLAVARAKRPPLKKKKVSRDNRDAVLVSRASVPDVDPIPVANGITPSQPPVATPVTIPVAVPTTVPGVAALTSPVAPGGPSRKRGRPPKSQAPNESPAPKKPRKSKKPATEPVPEPTLEQDDTAAPVVPPALEAPTQEAIPQATAGEQNVEAVIAPFISVSTPSNSHPTGRCRDSSPRPYPRPFTLRTRSPCKRQEGSSQHHQTCREDSKAMCSEELIRGQYIAREGIPYFNTIVSSPRRTTYRPTVITFPTTGQQ